MLGGCAQGIAEADKLVQAGDYAIFDVEIDDGFVFGQAQIAQRIDEECGTSTDFIAQQGNASTRVVIGFDHDVFQFVAKILLDGDFVLFFDFGIIREHADRMEVLAASAFVGGEKFLHRIGGVRTVIENLRERRMARANAGERIAQDIGLLRGGFALLA